MPVMPVAFVMMAGRRAVLPHPCSASSHLVYILHLACISEDCSDKAHRICMAAPDLTLLITMRSNLAAN